MAYYDRNRTQQPQPVWYSYCPRCGGPHLVDGEVCDVCGPLSDYCPYCSGAGGEWGSGEWRDCENCEGTGEK